MTLFSKMIAAAALAGAASVPAAAQYQNPQPYQQPYPQPAPQPYGGYGYPAQPYGNDQNVIGSIVDSLIGNRYDVSYRQAIRQCAFAAVRQAGDRYGGDRSGQPYPGYNNSLRVMSIDSVERRTLVIRVRGTLGRGRYGGDRYDRDGNQPYDPRYRDHGFGRAELSFRCDVDRNGYVSKVRLEPVLYQPR
jgi:hypothetical protein